MELFWFQKYRGPKLQEIGMEIGYLIKAVKTAICPICLKTGYSFYKDHIFPLKGGVSVGVSCNSCQVYQTLDIIFPEWTKETWHGPVPVE